MLSYTPESMIRFPMRGLAWVVVAALAVPWGAIVDPYVPDPGCSEAPNSIQAAQHAACDSPIPHHHNSSHPLCEHLHCVAAASLSRDAAVPTAQPLDVALLDAPELNTAAPVTEVVPLFRLARAPPV